MLGAAVSPTCSSADATPTCAALDSSDPQPNPNWDPQFPKFQTFLENPQNIYPSHQSTQSARRNAQNAVLKPEA